MRIGYCLLVVFLAFFVGIGAGWLIFSPLKLEPQMESRSVATSPPITAPVLPTDPDPNIYHLLAMIEERENAERALKERLKEPPPDSQFVRELRKKVFSILAYPKDEEASRELESRKWLASAVVILHKGKPVVVGSAYLLVTHEQSALIENSFGAMVQGLQMKPEWNKPDPRLAFSVTDYRGNEFPCRLIRSTPEFDVASFSIDNPEDIQPETITQNLGRADEGDWVVVGYCNESSPAAKAVQLGGFHISAFSNFGTVGNLFEVALPLAPGSSGGPVWNGNGELIGVVSSSDQKTRTLFTHWESIRWLLEGS